jgi:hypothetical protein
MKRVPRCKECDLRGQFGYVYITHYCKYEGFENRSICVDKICATSPAWCPKRNKAKKEKEDAK